MCVCVLSIFVGEYNSYIRYRVRLSSNKYLSLVVMVVVVVMFVLMNTSLLDDGEQPR